MKRGSLNPKERRVYTSHARRVRQALLQTARKGTPGPRPKEPRRSVSRADVQAKTDGNCHMCGDTLTDTWQIGHVKAHRRGGKSTVENCLPICAECNRLRWTFRPEVIRLLLEFGRYAKQAIRGKGGKPTKLGEDLIEVHIRNSWTNRRRKRRRSGSAHA